MNDNLPTQGKSEAALREEAILAFWKENNVFQKTTERAATEGEYVFFEGPPTANGRPGIHHVAARSFKDIIPRYKTMRGFSVHRKAGWDTHGLPVELQVEKALDLKSKKEIETYGVAEFNKQCKESVWQYKDEWEKLTERMGYWLDMEHPYVTYDNSYIEALWSVVKRADERGHLYKDFKVLPWCTRCGTALSSHELNQPDAHKDVKDLSVYAKFKIVGVENGYFLAWTTTPWTLPGNVALAVGNDIDYVEAKVGDEVWVLAKERLAVLTDPYEVIAEHKGSEMVGMQYEPLYPFLSELLPEAQKEKLANAFKVYPADFVTTTDGTGIVHTAVMYGAEDFELGTKVGLPKFHTVNEEGKFISGTGFLEGRYVKEADENGKPTLAVDIVDDLTKRGLLFKKENYLHAYPHCWRCNTPLVYYARTSWYFNMSKLRQQLLDANEKINWEPDHIKEGRFGEWLDGIKDWAISRDRYWGTPLPIWETEDKKDKVTIGSLADLKKYAKKSGNKYFVMRHGQAVSNTKNGHESIWETGADKNNHITDLGRQEILESAAKFSEKIDIIVHSPVLRTVETAELFAKTIGFSGEMISDARLSEVNVGDKYQGQLAFDYFKQFSHYTERYLKPNPDGENYNDVKRRATEVLYEYEQNYQGKTILFVSHGGVIMNMIVGSTGAHPEDIKDTIESVAYPKNAEIRELDFVPLPHNENYELDFHKPYIDQIELELDGKPLKRTAEVMDVWFDSGSMPYAQDHKLGEPVDFKPLPADYIAEGVDQTRGWFYTMHAVANMLNDQPTQAYKNVICMGLLLDANGIKMSKSKGNIVEPWAMFDKYGADVIRFWFYSVNQPGESKNFDEKSLAELQNKFFRVIENSFQMIEMHGGAEVSDTPQPMDLLDKWIWCYLAETNRDVTKALEAYDIFTAARKLKDFVTDFSQWYIRLSREGLRAKAVSRNLMMGILQQLSLLLAPFAPFTAEQMWMRIYGQNHQSIGSVHLWGWPKPNMFSDLTEEDQKNILVNMTITREVVSSALAERQKVNIKVRQPLAKLSIAETGLSEEYFELIKSELNVKEVVVDASLQKGTVLLDTNLTDELKNEGSMREMVRQIQDMRKDAGLMPSDRVVVSLTEAEPAWFGTYQAELFETVGAEKVVWGSVGTKVEKVG